MSQFYHYGMHAHVTVDDKGKKTISKYGRIFNSVKELKDFELNHNNEIKEIPVSAPEPVKQSRQSNSIDRETYLKYKGE
ncbi:hypothetical protein G7062_10425 [Erysipelothrix sp. HDW6C]|uniref:hypothetical protein n=1 Tax=Erysipelothrix sp. HDW6C TaxID=2714930 RepID=UPI00140B5E0F|nr:hypothetical protein [Erysipelothrix sp. HDW6C]QIK70692.1 hypothetical protein G7062_10425 [Erysipelothrix sp. HDW6C]